MSKSQSSSWFYTWTRQRCCTSALFRFMQKIPSLREAKRWCAASHVKMLCKRNEHQLSSDSHEIFCIWEGTFALRHAQRGCEQANLHFRSTRETLRRDDALSDCFTCTESVKKARFFFVQSKMRWNEISFHWDSKLAKELQWTFVDHLTEKDSKKMMQKKRKSALWDAMFEWHSESNLTQELHWILVDHRTKKISASSNISSHSNLFKEIRKQEALRLACKELSLNWRNLMIGRREIHARTYRGRKNAVTWIFQI